MRVLVVLIIFMILLITRHFSLICFEIPYHFTDSFV